MAVHAEHDAILQRRLAAESIRNAMVIVEFAGIELAGACLTATDGTLESGYTDLGRKLPTHRPAP
jgi:hypothetical protein